MLEKRVWLTSHCLIVYHISSIGRCGYYFFHCSF